MCFLPSLICQPDSWARCHHHILPTTCCPPQSAHRILPTTAVSPAAGPACIPAGARWILRSGQWLWADTHSAGARMEGEALHPHEGSFGDPKSPCQGACRRVHGCWTHLCLSMHAWACEHGSDPFRNETCSPAVGPCPWSVTTAATEQHPCPRAGSQHMEPLVAMAPDTTAGAAGRQRQGRCPGDRKSVV